MGSSIWKCRKMANDVYEMRKDINEIRSKVELSPSDIGEPTVFEDPFAAYDADLAAWHAAQKGSAASEEEEEEAPVRPRRHPSRRSRRPERPHGKAPIVEEEEVQDDEETEEEAEFAIVSQ